MVLKKTEIFLWPYTDYDAGVYLRNVLRFNSNLELLLECQDFLGKLDLHEFIFHIDDKPSLEYKKLRFHRLEISKWTTKQTVISILFHFIDRDARHNKLEFVVSNYIPRHMKFICNTIYSDAVIDLYTLFDIFHLYPEQCVNGCIQFFYYETFHTEIKTYLYHPGLKKVLNLVEIESKPLEEILNLCTYLRSISPFIVFLKKYKKKNYNAFFNQSYYDQLFTILQSCHYTQLENFYINKNDDIEILYFELAQIEKQRIINLIFNQVKKNIEKKKVFFTWVTALMSLGAAVVIVRPEYRENYYFHNPHFSSYAAFATMSRNFTPEASVSSSSSAYQSNFARDTSQSVVQSRTSSIIIPKHTQFASSSDIREAEKKFLGEKLFIKNKKLLVQRLKQWNCFNEPSTSESANLENRRPSTESTEIPAVSPKRPFATTKRIIAGERLKKKHVALLKNKKKLPNKVDELFIDGSEEKVGVPVRGLNQHIVRKKFKPDFIENLNLDKYQYAYFLPDSTGKFNRVTLSGNVCECDASKKLKTKFKKIVNQEKNSYIFVDNTFDHLIPAKWLKTMDIAQLPRGATGDPSIGPLMSGNANRIMGKTSIRLVQPFLDKQQTDSTFTVFQPNSKYDIADLFIIWSKNQQKAGLDRIIEKCDIEFKIAKEKIFQNLSTTTPNWTKLTSNQQYEKGFPGMRAYFEKKLDDPKGFILFDEALRGVYEVGYETALPSAVADIQSWVRQTRLKPEQSCGYFFTRTLVNSSESTIYTKFCLYSYNKPGFKELPCPLANCVYHIKEQTKKTKLLDEMCFHLKANWPRSDESTDNAELHTLLEQEKYRMTAVNKKLLNGSREIFSLVKEEIRINGQLPIFDKNGTQIESNEEQYMQKFDEKITKFENDLKQDNCIDPSISTPESTFDLIFDDNNGWNLDYQSGSLSFSPERFIKPLEFRSQMPPEKYPLVLQLNPDGGSEEPSPSDYIN